MDIEELEAELKAFERRVEPSIKLYEALIPFGIDRYAEPLIRAFSKQYEAAQNGKQQTSIWNLKWARWGAIVGLIYGFLQIMLIILVAYNTIFGVHHT